VFVGLVALPFILAMISLGLSDQVKEVAMKISTLRYGTTVLIQHRAIEANAAVGTLPASGHKRG